MHRHHDRRYRSSTQTLLAESPPQSHHRVTELTIAAQELIAQRYHQEPPYLHRRLLRHAGWPCGARSAVTAAAPNLGSPHRCAGAASRESVSRPTAKAVRSTSKQ